VLPFTIACSTKTSDDLCTHGNGKTTLQGQVLDFYTKKPIDSVEIRIVWGSSWDHFLDTLIKQNDSISFAFNLQDDCEPYFFTLSNRHYWTDIEHHPAYKVSIEKGAINNFQIQLKPATFLKINVQRDTLDNSRDVVQLQIRKAKTGDWERWEEISANDFTNRPADYISTTYDFLDSGTYRTISAYYDIESNTDYDLRWTLLNSKHSDTLYYHFTATPFDTVRLNYAFKKQ
jgi:hypothetical protein